MSSHEPSGPLRLMTVHAHPDDESSKGAASSARYVTEGHEVMVVTCTGGEAGSILNPAMDRPEVLADMHNVRRGEMARAAQILGVQHRWLGFVDSGLPEGDPKPPLPEGCFALVDVEEATAPLVALIREFRPHVVVTYDENGGYPHPDHIKTHVVSMAAFDAAADPDRFPGAGDPWQPLKLYYSHGFSKSRILAFDMALKERGLSRPTTSGWPTGPTTGPTPACASPPASSVPTTSTSVTGRCSPTRRRSTRPVAGSSCRSTSSARSGPPRTTSSRTR